MTDASYMSRLAASDRRRGKKSAAKPPPAGQRHWPSEAQLVERIEQLHTHLGRGQPQIGVVAERPCGTSTGRATHAHDRE